ncbi:anthranilate phosphoribosyltransferase [Taibaiella koreensis]|uniref:anthranilate phosphoribosyltransferase n=1 Tax=Taibaiella koreensis TaxID=1268548 RepID=UPI001F09FCB5|nr:anthranilate phosphoribosyltransferase [Taibaiella koreensis]
MNTLSLPDGALPYMMKKVLDRLNGYETLSYTEAKEVLLGITGGMVNESQMTAFISAFMMRPVTLPELAGFRDALLEQAVKPGLPATDAIDIVGTGGDGKHTFNISTLSAVVVAACGYRVIKHGNYGATSVSGSSNVLEYLGYRFTADRDILMRQLDRAGICFLHAPLFHPAMRRVAGIRKNLGLRTFFNLLGPLTNPVQPAYLLLGVNTLEAARLFHYLLQDSPLQYRIVHSLDGYDELSLTGPARLYTPETQQVITPAALGLPQLTAEELYAGKDVKTAAAIFSAVLQQEATPAQQQVVIANAAMAIHTIDAAKPFSDCLAVAAEALRSGKALETFNHIINTN